MIIQEKTFSQIYGIRLSSKAAKNKVILLSLYNYWLMWMTAIKRRLNNADTVKQFQSNDGNKDGEVSWEEHTTWFWKENKATDYNKHLLSDDERRFTLADVESDGKLTSQQFAAFLHPEDDERMIQYMVNQTVDHLDSNSDRVVSLDEYIADLWTGEGKKPKWITTEEETFSKSRDQNKDGVMDLCVK